MGAHEMFISVMIILLIFNVFYVFSFPESTWNLTIGAITGFLALILSVSALAVFGGILINTEAVKILFGCGSLLNVLFQINIGGFPIGLGLVTNVLSVFGTEFFGVGMILTSILGILAFVSGLIIVTGG